MSHNVAGAIVLLVSLLETVIPPTSYKAVVLLTKATNKDKQNINANHIPPVCLLAVSFRSSTHLYNNLLSLALPRTKAGKGTLFKVKLADGKFSQF